MRLFKRSVEEAMDKLEMPEEVTLPQPSQISDVLCTRDSYFHSCWLRAKLLHPELIPEMGQIELFIAGFDTSTEEESEETEEEGEPNGTII